MRKFRARVPRRKNRRMFSRTASKVHAKNARHIMRGGIKGYSVPCYHPLYGWRSRKPRQMENLPWSSTLN